MHEFQCETANCIIFFFVGLMVTQQMIRFSMNLEGQKPLLSSGVTGLQFIFELL